MPDDSIFPRNFKRRYPVAVRGEGVFLFDADGKKYLDACGGAAVVTIGHGVHEVIEAIALQSQLLSYVHSSQFTTSAAAELAQVLAAKFPDANQRARVHFTSGGSEATETAIKIARAYWLARGEPQRYKIISRWGSYHGTTLGALSASGNKVRREAFAPLLPAAMEHISACFCYRCPLGLEFPACALACAEELNAAIEKAGAKNVAAFICEPVVGASSGAVPPDGYLQKIRDICDAHGILFIADEVMSGAGRTGKYFAVEHWNVVLDMILAAKGLASGYAPLGAVLVGEKIWRAIESGPGSLDHGFTYQAHPPSLAAGLAVQRYLDHHNLVEQSRLRGDYLAKKLAALRNVSCVGDIRGKGLLQTVEFVADKATKKPFAKEFNFNFRLFENMQARGVMVYPMRGTVEGGSGDHVLLAPPFVIEESQIDFLVEHMRQALEEVSRAAQVAGAAGN